jgi:hypothetical protein
MSTTPLTLQQFGAQVKSKYPDYANKSDEEVGRAMLAKFPQYKSRVKEPDTMQATPSALSPAGIKSNLLTARDWAVSQLPAAGGVVGGLVGALTGAETGPGAIIPATVGAGAGGAAGEAAKQSLTEKFHPEDAKMGPIETGVRIAGEGVLQGANELGGQVAGRTVGKLIRPIADKVGAATLAKYPFLKTVFAVGEGSSPKAAQHLTAAAANKQNAGVALESISRTMDDLESEITKLPPEKRTVEGFLNSVNSRKDAMNAESGAAMLPIAGQKTVPMGVAQNIRNLARSYMNNTVEGRRQGKYILDRAAEYQKPWSYGELDQLRSDLAAQTAKHRAKDPVAKYASEKGDIDLQIDNAILDGLRDTVYPEMDRAAGKPQGYFADLKGRQSSLIDLQSILDKRVKALKGSEAISEVAPRFGSENISLSEHIGSPLRAGVYGIRQSISPTREMTTASKHVKKAFPSVNALPYTALFGTGVRAAEAPVTGPKKPVAAALAP